MIRPTPPASALHRPNRVKLQSRGPKGQASELHVMCYAGLGLNPKLRMPESNLATSPKRQATGRQCTLLVYRRSGRGRLERLGQSRAPCRGGAKMALLYCYTPCSMNGNRTIRATHIYMRWLSVSLGSAAARRLLPHSMIGGFSCRQASIDQKSATCLIVNRAPVGRHRGMHLGRGYISWRASCGREVSCMYFTTTFNNL